MGWENYNGMKLAEKEIEIGKDNYGKNMEQGSSDEIPEAVDCSGES